MADQTNKPFSLRLYSFSRQLHRWVGLMLIPLALIAGLTGFYLNHTSLFKPYLQQLNGDPNRLVGTVRPGDAGAFSEDEARSISTRLWNSADIKKVRFKTKKSRLVVTVYKKNSKDRIIFDPVSGQYQERSRYRTRYYGYDGEHMLTRYRWGNIFKRLHTGKIGGDVGGLLADIFSLALLGFALTGLYMWSFPRLRRRYQA